MAILQYLHTEMNNIRTRWAYSAPQACRLGAGSLSLHKNATPLLTLWVPCILLLVDQN